MNTVTSNTLERVDFSQLMANGKGHGNTLYGADNQFLDPTDYMVSVNGKYILIYQIDGNLALYNQEGIALWTSNTQGKPAWKTYMQPDGNFVVYRAYHQPVWASNTPGNENAKIVLQDDGNLVIYSRTGRVLWSSGTSQSASVLGEGTDFGRSLGSKDQFLNPEYYISSFEEYKKAIGMIDVKKTTDNIFQNELENRGIDWRAFYEGDKKHHKEVNALLKSFDLDIDAEQLVDTVLSKSLSKAVKEVPNIALANSLKEQGIDYVLSLRGDDIKKYLLHTTKSLQIAESQPTALQLGVNVANARVFGIDMQWIEESRQYLQQAIAQAAVTAAPIAAAIVWGAEKLGYELSKTKVGIVVTLVLLPILYLMDKKAQMLALVLNRTSKNVLINDYYFGMGELVTKPVGYDADQRPVAMPARTKEDFLEVASGGFMFTRKKEIISGVIPGMVGVLGACRLEFEGGSKVFPNGVFLGHRVPLLLGSSNCKISCQAYANAEDFYNKTEDQFNIGGIEEDDTKKVQTFMDSENGNSVFMISSVEEKV